MHSNSNTHTEASSGPVTGLDVPITKVSLVVAASNNRLNFVPTSLAHAMDMGYLHMGGRARARARVCVCVCACATERERERERERDSVRERERERECVCVCVCVHAHVCVCQCPRVRVCDVLQTYPNTYKDHL